MKTVILHYHLFKNAGTSLDAAFKENFSEEKGEWVTKEFPAQPVLNREQVKQWILDNPQAKCFSSHTAMLPPPQIEGVKVIPVIFFRHPIDRIASAYAFEKKQGGQGFGPTLARNTTLSGYIETRLSVQNDRQCRNFHTHRLAMMFGEKIGSEEFRASKAVKALPFIGLVEDYENSLLNLSDIINNKFGIEVNLEVVKKNVSREVGASINEKLLKIRDEIGEKLYLDLERSNASDLELWKKISGEKF